MDNLDRHRDARALLSARRAGVLSTLSVQVDGYPFGSVVPYCLDRGGRPVIMISEIAQHTANLDADPRACLTVLDGGDDVQAAARLSVVARSERIEEGVEDAAERYVRCFPASRGYHSAHAFFLARLDPVRLRYIGGFGDIRWIEPEELLLANPFSREQETAIIEHMNDDHVEALRGYCALAGVEVGDSEEVAMAGIDAEGVDLLCEGRPLRLTFPQPVADPGEARERLIALAR